MKMKFKILILLIGILIPKLSYGVEFDAESETDVDSLKTCPADYYSFVSKVRTERERFEYFTDFFSKSYCQVEDIIQINDELEKIREDFREAALACEDTGEYKKQYIKLVMEHYFVRHVQEIPSDIIDESELEKIEEQKTQILESLHDEMYQIYVVQKSQVSEKTFETYFDGWTSEYDEKIGNYANCEEGPWAELGDTIDDFKKTLEDLSVDTEEEEPEVPEEKASFRTDIAKNVQEFYKKFLWEEESKVEDELDVDEAAKKSGSILGTFELLENDDERFAMDTASAERLARYKILYGEGGAKVSDNLQAVVTNLNEVIAETNAKEFPEVISKAGSVYEKQCR